MKSLYIETGTEKSASERAPVRLLGCALEVPLPFGGGPYVEFCSLEVFKPEEELSAAVLDYRSGGIYLFSEILELLSPTRSREKN